MVPNDLLSHLPLLHMLVNQDSVDPSERVEMEDAVKAYQKLVLELNRLRDKRHARLRAEIGDGIDTENSTFVAKATVASASDSVASPTMASIINTGISTEQKVPESLAAESSVDQKPKSREKIGQVKHSDRELLLNDFHVQLSPSMCKPTGTIAVQANIPRSPMIHPAGLLSEHLEKELSKTFHRKVDLFVDDGQTLGSCKSLDKLLGELKPRFPELTM